MKSVWVEASAGTGKTKNLVDRVLLLLVTGHKGILCLTFTNSAADEMLARISNKLRSWVMLSDQELQNQISDLTEVYNEQVIIHARSLFCKLPELVSIKTLHSFCYGLISEFSGEARQNLLEYKDSLYYQAINKFLSEDPNLGDLALSLSKKVLFALCEELEALKENFSYYFSYFKKLKLDPLQQYCCHQIIDIMLNGSKRDIKHAELLRTEQKKVFLTQEGQKKKISSIITKDLQMKFPHLAEFIEEAQQKFCLNYHVQNKREALKRTELILDVISQIFTIFNKIKEESLTYNEVIQTTLKLLQDPRYSSLVMFSLSSRVKHILVDEAQDNSESQWEIIRLLTEDFFFGIGVGNTQNTIFVVGDAKQSIYSFQGADPKLFSAMDGYFTYKAEMFGQSLDRHNLITSYRSAETILSLVDKVFNQFRREISFCDKEIKHICHRKDEQGHIELWPLVCREGESDDKLILARNIAEKIAALVNKTYLSSNEKITEEGIMVLVRRRDIFIHYLIKELEKRKLQVGGYDRFVITDHITVKDLLSLGKVLLDPKNDFELVKVLKSPIFNLTEGEIFSLCFARGESRVWQRLEEYHPKIFNQINKLRIKRSNTFQLYYQIICEKNLGEEYIINKFLKLALAHPILSDFLTFMESNKIEVKNKQRGGIKIMTVHGAKGLESRIVFLADTTQLPQNKNHITLNDEHIPFYLQDNNFDNIKEKANKQIYEEYIRLLYVSLTRAKDQLYITGCGQAKKGSWYNILSSAMKKIDC